MTEKIAYLTIDDAPTKDFKEKVDFLVDKGINAVFFCRGDLLEERLDDAVYAIKKGFIIGNHTYGHKGFSDLELEECFERISKADKLIEEAYQKAGIERPAKFFRFPYGDKGGHDSRADYEEDLPYSAQGAIKKGKIQVFLRDLGYTQPKFGGITYKYYQKLLNDVDWFWTYDVMEWCIGRENALFGINTIEKVFERMEEDVPEGCRGLNYTDSEDIILLHDFAETTKYFYQIINRLLEKGIIFKPIPIE